MHERDYANACREIAEILMKTGIGGREEIAKLKSQVAKRYGLHSVPSNVDIMRYAPPQYRDKLRELLKRKPVRSVSGIVTISVMTEPFDCPHGRCAYCPRFPGSPVSYTGREPAAMRGIQYGFDPALQFRARVKQLESMGHTVDKVEIIIQGGTFNATPERYRNWFMSRLLEGVIGYKTSTYEEALLAAERAKYRITGMTIETRPDQCEVEQVDWMLEKGFTRVELGVQTLYDDVYADIKRGHGVKEVREATRNLKDAGFKIGYHMMPGLPGTGFLRDLNAFRSLFENENYRPDMLKIYPTLVIDRTEIHERWLKGEYKPYSTSEAFELISAVKANLIPRWVRIMRVQRDIPAFEIVDGVKKGNLREIIASGLRKRGLRCPCIRCREIGHKALREELKEPIQLEMTVRRYLASGGVEYFIAIEDVVNDSIIGFLRLRKPSRKAWRPEITSNETFIVRELHVYGEALPIGAKSGRSWQHRGVGAALLRKAEKIAKDCGGDKIVVISGVGSREYYYRHGYKREGPYVSKLLT